ncbi:MAG TPA: hypothetical protein VJ302_16850, partial [Blastocatellia bacterium]|nr:hypothetical protein [Blastocatellia bacterium]
MAYQNYTVTIKMNSATVTALINSGNYLFGFKAVQSSDQAGRPLVWSRTQDFSTTTAVNWTNQYNAYTSHTDIEPGALIQVVFSAPALTGQTLEVVAGGTGSVVNSGPTYAISVLNTTTTPFTCGLAEGSAASPLCAFPLYGNNLQTITPLEKILLLFSTEPTDPGTVVSTFYNNLLLARESLSQGILIDMTGSTQRS